MLCHMMLTGHAVWQLHVRLTIKNNTHTHTHKHTHKYTQKTYFGQRLFPSTRWVIKPIGVSSDLPLHTHTCTDTVMTKPRCCGEVRTRWEVMDTMSHTTDSGLLSHRQLHIKLLHCKGITHTCDVTVLLTLCHMTLTGHVWQLHLKLMYQK